MSFRDNVLEAIATGHGDVRLRPATEPLEALPPSLPATIADRATVSPDDRLEQAFSELREGVVVELLEQLSEVPPEYSETIVLDLLHEMAEDRF